MNPSPGNIQPEWLGIVWPSAFAWIWIYLGLIALVLSTQFMAWAYYQAVGDDQYADPETRERMDLSARVSIFGSRMRPTLERLAEPQRSRALRLYAILNIAFVAVVACAALTLTIYTQFVAA